MDLLSADNPVFAGFAFYCMVLVVKMMLLYVLTVRQRFRKKVRSRRSLRPPAV